MPQPVTQLRQLLSNSSSPGSPLGSPDTPTLPDTTDNSDTDVDVLDRVPMTLINHME
jgi:hypothetical protein